MPPPIQYGIRHLMVLTVVVAVAASAVAPIVRGWDTKGQVSFAIHLTVSLALIAAYTFFMYRFRIRAQRNAVEAVLRVRSPDTPRTRALLLTSITILFVLMLVCAVLLNRNRNSIESGHFLWAVTWPALIISPVLARLWWGVDYRSIEFCENGIVLSGLSYVSYMRFKHYRWESCGAKRLILVKRLRTWGSDVLLRIPDEMRDEVSRLLEERGVSPAKEEPETD